MQYFNTRFYNFHFKMSMNLQIPSENPNFTKLLSVTPM